MQMLCFKCIICTINLWGVLARKWSFFLNVWRNSLILIKSTHLICDRCCCDATGRPAVWSPDSPLRSVLEDLDCAVLDGFLESLLYIYLSSFPPMINIITALFLLGGFFSVGLVKDFWPKWWQCLKRIILENIKLLPPLQKPNGKRTCLTHYISHSHYIHRMRSMAHDVFSVGDCVLLPSICGYTRGSKTRASLFCGDSSSAVTRRFIPKRGTGQRSAP